MNEEDKKETPPDKYWWRKLPGSTDDWEIIYNCIKKAETTMYIEYTAEEYTEACRVLLKLRESYEYDSSEYKSINIALDAIDRIDWKHE